MNLLRSFVGSLCVLVALALSTVAGQEKAWWPADVGDWPEEAHGPLRAMARLLEAP